MNPLTLIAKELDVAPALAELARRPDYCWIDLAGDGLRFIQLLGGDGQRLVRCELSSVWRLIEVVKCRAARDQDDRGTICHARVGLMPPGSSLPPHFDGIDGIRRRRYQIALRSEPGVRLTVGDETKTPNPGEAWWIDASRTHSVVNGSPSDRITILFDTEARPSA